MAVKVLRRRELTFLGEALHPAGPQRPQDHLGTLFPEPLSSRGARLGLLKRFSAAVTFQYPEEPRPLEATIPKPTSAHRPRRRNAPLRRVHALRNRLPGQVHHDRGRRAPRSQRREVPNPLRHRPGGLRLLRILCRGLSRGRDPHGHGNPRRGRVLQGRDEARHPSS